jgi:hypothetical protein
MTKARLSLPIITAIAIQSAVIAEVRAAGAISVGTMVRNNQCYAIFGKAYSRNPAAGFDLLADSARRNCERKRVPGTRGSRCDNEMGFDQPTCQALAASVSKNCELEEPTLAGGENRKVARRTALLNCPVYSRTGTCFVITSTCH